MQDVMIVVNTVVELLEAIRRIMTEQEKQRRVAEIIKLDIERIIHKIKTVKIEKTDSPVLNILRRGV